MKKLFWFIPLIGMLLLSTKSCSTENTPVYELTTNAEPSEAGTVNASAARADQGQSISITAVPNQHWVFSGWAGDHSGSQNPASIVMDRDMNVTAMFVKRDYPLSITIEGEGTVAEEVIQAKTTDYPHGTMVQLTAQPVQGWHFIEWQGDLQSADNPATITINQEKSVTAVFERIDYPLTITIQGEGTVEQQIVAAKTTEYPFETVVELTATPADGWEFTRWEGDLGGSENPQTITIDEEKNVTAVFELSVPPAGTVALTVQNRDNLSSREEATFLLLQEMNYHVALIPYASDA